MVEKQQKHKVGTALFGADSASSYLPQAALTLSANEHDSAESFDLKTLHAPQHLQILQNSTYTPAD